MSNLPPGVTGFEYQISGAADETVREYYCPRCEWEGSAYAEIDHLVVTVWCPECEYQDEWMIWEEEEDV